MGEFMIDDLFAMLARHAERTPDMPASLALSVKDYDELCRKIVCQPVTPCGVALVRLKELTDTSCDD